MDKQGITMDILTVALDRKICATCHHWQGARESASATEILCLRQSEDICQLREQLHDAVLDTIVPCDSGESCPNWRRWDRK